MIEEFKILSALIVFILRFIYLNVPPSRKPLHFDVNKEVKVVK